MSQLNSARTDPCPSYVNAQTTANRMYTIILKTDKYIHNYPIAMINQLQRVLNGAFTGVHIEPLRLNSHIILGM